MDLFKRRTKDRIAEHARRARAHGAALDYGLCDLRNLIHSAIADGKCPFCRGPITEANFGIDHADPVCRSGGFDFANLIVCCMPCNSAKGPLTATEFRALLAILATWPEQARKNTLARLKAGARYARW